MTEIEYVQDVEIVEERDLDVQHQDAIPSWELLKSEWAMGHHQKLLGQLRQARAAASVRTHYGSGSVEGFAKEMDVAPTTVYEYARAWRRLLEAFESEHEIYSRLEDSPLKITQVIESARGPIKEIPKALDEAEGEGLSGKAIQARRQEKSTPKNVETIDLICCPRCGEIYPLREAETRTEAV